MTIKRLLASTSVLLLCVLLTQGIYAQNKTITGKITDSKDGTPIVGATVQPKGSKSGTSTGADGTFSIVVGPNVVTLVISSVGYDRQELSIEGKSYLDVNMVASNASLNEVVVVGYGTARKKDLTGSVGSVQAKDFNKGPVVNPDQLLQGKVAGLQVINSSGQPGAATVVKIRGNNSIRSGNTPLYVVDGVLLDGRSPRPDLFSNSGVGTTPDINPLNFINPNDIASIDVLKDASAAAIFGSRGANGVILITTKKGVAGKTQVDVAASAGISSAMRKIKILDAGGFRNALKTYNLPATLDKGASVDAFKEIQNTSAAVQNYSVALSGGNDNGKFRASFLASDQQGLIRKSGLSKYVGNFNGQYKFLDKKLSIDFNVTAASLKEQIAPISNDAGSTGNLISLALNWNPTLAFRNANGLYQQNTSLTGGLVNPMAFSDAYNDGTTLTQMMASISAAYKILPNLEYKLLYGTTYGVGERRSELQAWIKGTGGNADGNGLANVSNAQLFSQTITHTLNYTAHLTDKITLNAIGGFEYWKTAYQKARTFTYGFDLDTNETKITPNYHYYDNMDDGNLANLKTDSYKDPTVELQSYFARAVFNYQDRYILTATFRADGSSKFGANNKYAYFPSVAAAWNISNEDFMKNNTMFNSLKIRLGYGQTGNQEFNPVDAAINSLRFGNFRSSSVQHYGNADLKWETVSSVDGGVDFTMLKGRFWGFVDYFYKKTIDPILDFTIAQPTGGSNGTVYKNLDGKQGTQKGWVINKGLEVSLGGAIIEKKDLIWNVTANATFVKNSFESPDLAKIASKLKNTGALHGAGSSGAYSEAIAPGQPIDVFFLEQFKGFDKTTGLPITVPGPVFAGDPNPKAFVGFSTDLTYKKFTLTVNMTGAFGHLIYNNTAMSVTYLNNITKGRNIAANLVGNGESLASGVAPSTRYLEKGDYLKMSNATIAYKLGAIGTMVKNAQIYVTGSNLFVITKYTGFDPEVNIDKSINGIPSLGVDYIGYPSARIITLGVNFSLY